MAYIYTFGPGPWSWFYEWIRRACLVLLLALVLVPVLLLALVPGLTFGPLDRLTLEPVDLDGWPRPDLDD